MKKIGILTYHSYDNYGAVLQAYALQTYILKHLKKDVEIINFCTDKQVQDNDVLQLKGKKTIRSIISILYHKLPIYCQLRKRRHRFNQFRKEYLVLTKRYKDAKSLTDDIPFEDIYITGSDQVFNPYAEYTEVYYLGFKKDGARKVAYAPSFGVADLEESVNKRLQCLIRDFDYISCREQVGADYLSKLLGKNVPCVVDPVFLLTNEEWNIVMKKTKLNNSYSEGYIFVYRLNGGLQLMQLAQKVSETVNLPIICVATDNLYKTGCVVNHSAGPLELFGLIKGASYVVTDSFHGTALSLVFGVKVIPYIAFRQASSRITTIMENIGLSRNIIYNVDDFDFNSLFFTDYEIQLRRYKDFSEKFLSDALS